MCPQVAIVLRTSLVRGYGYLLEFCRRNGMLHDNTEPAGYVTPKVIEAFAHELHGRVGSVTRVSSRLGVGSNPGLATSVVCTLTMRFFEIGIGGCGSLQNSPCRHETTRTVIEPRLRIWGFEQIKIVRGMEATQAPIRGHLEPGLGGLSMIVRLGLS
jgi:hypothetical protein